MESDESIEGGTPSTSPEQLAAIKVIQDRLAGALENLNEDERAAVGQLFGLTHGVEHALEDVAAKFGTSVQRLVELEAETLKKVHSQQAETSSGQP